MMFTSKNDTISALATPANGAIAVIRVSGPKAITITDEIFRPASGHPLSGAKANTLHYGEIIDTNDLSPESLEKREGRLIDDVMVSVYHAPHSYTGEESVEISCHGSRYIIQQILLLLQSHGTRQAEPGEYTRRAYLNGKMDLSQAEAVADVISSTNKATHDLAISQLKGHVRTALEALREKLQKLTALLELELDFSDHEDLEFADRTELKTLAHDIDSRLTRLAETYRTGKAIKEGIPVAIVGKTNVGKSTLLNCLLGEERAIVSDVPGTTRDAIEDVVDINGMSFRFVDTAGIRNTDDKVERIGIDRAYEQINKASVILWVVDTEPSDEEIEWMKKITDGKHIIIVRNKIDVEGNYKAPGSTESCCSNKVREKVKFKSQSISAKNGTNIDLLREKIYEAANIPQLNESDVIITSTRQYALIEEARQNLHRVIEGLASNLSSDLVAEDLRLVIDNLSDVTGIEKISSQTTLNEIFEHFCIGK